MAQFDDSVTNARLEELHHAEEERLVAALAPKYGYPYVNLKEVPVDIEALRLLSEADSKRGELAIFAKKDAGVLVAARNPRNPDLPTILDIIRGKGLTPTVYLASLQSVTHAWERYHDQEKVVARSHGVLDVDAEIIKKLMGEVHSQLDVGSMIAHVEGEHSNTKTSQVIEIIFGGALALAASDVHIEPEKITTRIRYRLDGVLVDVANIDRGISAQIVSRLKLLSGLKLNVRKESQDGRFTFNLGEREVEIRTSVIPGAYGESMVMRLLDPNASNFKFATLGLSARLLEVIEKELKRPNGAIITTGPTGSGKTTALYSFLQAIHTPELKIITLENPVEYKLPGIVQIQVGQLYTFEEGLRSVLRQDPDVILVGEVRDAEVASTMIHAALTGHLVLTTLHTNSAAAAFARLIDLGVDPRMIGSAVNVILGQRLVRVLCPHCKKERPITTEELAMIQRVLETPIAINTIFDAVGCEKCGMSGYKGRLGVFEAILVDEKVENAMLADSREAIILEAAKPQNIPTMQQDGLYKALGGVTSLDELARVLGLYVV